jgi:hypothetical protein
VYYEPENGSRLNFAMTIRKKINRIVGIQDIKVKECRRFFDALADLMETDYVGEWIKTPNEAFDGSTPLQVIERGEIDRIWRMIYRLETGEPV